MRYGQYSRSTIKDEDRAASGWNRGLPQVQNSHLRLTQAVKLWKVKGARMLDYGAE